MTAAANLLRFKSRSLVVVLCLVAVIFPFMTGISILEGIKAQAGVSVQEGADVYVAGDLYGNNAPVSTSLVSALKMPNSAVLSLTLPIMVTSTTRLPTSMTSAERP